MELGAKLWGGGGESCVIDFFYGFLLFVLPLCLICLVAGVLVVLERAALSSFFCYSEIERCYIFSKRRLFERRPATFNVKLVRGFVQLCRRRFVLRETDTGTWHETCKRMVDTSQDRMADRDERNR